MEEIIEKVGVCESKAFGYRAMFHRVKVKLSRFYRVWPFPGDSRSMFFSPDDYMSRFETIEYMTPDASSQKPSANIREGGHRLSPQPRLISAVGVI